VISIGAGGAVGVRASALNALTTLGARSCPGLPSTAGGARALASNEVRARSSQPSAAVAVFFSLPYPLLMLRACWPVRSITASSRSHGARRGGDCGCVAKVETYTFPPLDRDAKIVRGLEGERGVVFGR